jgi:hypothetical protein
LETISANAGVVRALHSFTLPVQGLDWLPDGSGLMTVGLSRLGGRGQISFVRYPSGEASSFTNDLANYDICCLAVTRDGERIGRAAGYSLERCVGGES